MNMYYNMWEHKKSHVSRMKPDQTEGDERDIYREKVSLETTQDIDGYWDGRSGEQTQCCSNIHIILPYWR
jgi:hypothetical protein